MIQVNDHTHGGDHYLSHSRVNFRQLASSAHCEECVLAVSDNRQPLDQLWSSYYEAREWGIRESPVYKLTRYD